MEDQGLPLDRISNLPSNIAIAILTLMPIKDAFKTSILSQSWRYHCVDIPKLTFDYTFHASVARNYTCKGAHIVYLILLLHQGQILDFSFVNFRQQISRWEIDQIIIHLSRRAATLKKLTLCIDLRDHKLSLAFFKLQQLMFLKLQGCVFQPPVTYKGFSKLVTLSFNNVCITAEVFQRFISSCPLLKDFTLFGDESHLTGCWNSNILECLSSIDRLCTSSYPIKCFAKNVIPQKLPAPLILKHLHLVGASILREINLFSAICLVICSSPNIETFIMEHMHIPDRLITQAVPQTAINVTDEQWVILHHLRLIKMINFINRKAGMNFLKLMLAKSPMLKDVHIVIGKNVDIHDEIKMLKELLRYPRASTRAEIRFERL
ncbi:F-box/FBD/LRR-repeat protein At1g13570-like [Bidens hawaiensis]|uniref:F-box/FBD/LRR-repeat protein At1g13570-like n=1 Tax=Bidens hawaiensis TaxID=980011 RepID=UPI00404946FE